MDLSSVPTSIIIGVTGIWFIFFFLGREQFKRLRANTQKIALEGIETALARNKNLSVNQYYKQINGQWEAMVPRTAKFIPHTSELYPIPVKIEDLRKRINFSPEWLGAYLKLTGYSLKAAPAQQECIDYIASFEKQLKN